MSEIKTGQLKANWKWMQGDCWQVGSIATELRGLFLMRSYHTGELSLVDPALLSSYPESPIPEPEVRS